MTPPRRMLEMLLEPRDLGAAEAGDLLRMLSDSDLDAAMAGALLAALRAKGVTPKELRGFAQAMRELSRRPGLPPHLDAIDIVGTGGDASGSLNLSTGAALLAAACGLPVIKHGNRSISSRSGSADLLEALGFALPLDEACAAACFAATGFTFLFAPFYHPAMKAVATVRAALGVRTVFNLLGPLTNPAQPRFLLAGAYDERAAELIAGSLAGTPIERGFVVHGAAGWDEATPLGPFVAFDVQGSSIHRSIIDPRDFGMTRCLADELKGGDAPENAKALIDVFEGRDQGPHRDALALQCGLALMVAGRAPSAVTGIAAARDCIDNGNAASWLKRLREFAAQPHEPPAASAGAAAVEDAGGGAGPGPGPGPSPSPGPSPGAGPRARVGSS